MMDCLSKVEIENRRLFRAMPSSSSSWVTGSYYFIGQKHYILPGSFNANGCKDLDLFLKCLEEINPDTLCESLGVRDDFYNDLIFEHDLIEIGGEKLVVPQIENNRYLCEVIKHRDTSAIAYTGFPESIWNGGTVNLGSSFEYEDSELNDIKTWDGDRNGVV